jgi:Periplasmic binding protein-like domain
VVTRSLLRALLRKDFNDFVEKAFATLAPGQDFVRHRAALRHQPRSEKTATTPRRPVRITDQAPIAIAGRGDEASMRRPALTTVAIGAREIGEETARLLLRRIKSPDGSSESIILPPKLIIRSSCGGGARQ